jgi:hypothetical protein
VPWNDTWTPSDYQQEIIVLSNKLSLAQRQVARSRSLLSSITASSETELESIVNTLLMKFNALRQQSVNAANSMEAEEEQIINGLLRRLSEVGRETREL